MKMHQRIIWSYQILIKDILEITVIPLHILQKKNIDVHFQKAIHV